MKETQMLKGVLDGCVLAIIAREEIYGYELVKTLKESGFPNIVGGTIYPLLQKLENKGCITSEIKKSPDGPDRKYFSITSEGIAYLKDFRLQWSQLENKVDRIVEE